MNGSVMFLGESTGKMPSASNSLRRVLGFVVVCVVSSRSLLTFVGLPSGSDDDCPGGLHASFVPYWERWRRVWKWWRAPTYWEMLW